MTVSHTELFQDILDTAFENGYEKEAVINQLVGDLYPWTGEGFGPALGNDELVTVEEKLDFIDWVVQKYGMDDDELESAFSFDKEGVNASRNPSYTLLDAALGNIILKVAEKKR